MILWGLKTEAAFDLWSLEHMANGLAIAYYARFVVNKFFPPADTNHGITGKQRAFVTVAVILAAALFWECAEHYVEAGVLDGILPGAAGAAVTAWFAGVEHWSNRLFADNVMVLLGAYIFFKKNNLVLYAKLFSLAWCVLHIFFLPDSMYLQRLISPTG